MGWKDRRVCSAVYAMYPSGTTIESLPGILIRVPLTNGVGDELVLGDGVVLEADPAGLDWPAHPAAARKTTDAIAEHHSFAHCFFIDVFYYRHPFAHNEPETGSKPRRGPRMRGSHTLQKLLPCALCSSHTGCSVESASHLPSRKISMENRSLNRFAGHHELEFLSDVRLRGIEVLNGAFDAQADKGTGVRQLMRGMFHHGDDVLQRMLQLVGSLVASVTSLPNLIDWKKQDRGVDVVRHFPDAGRNVVVNLAVCRDGICHHRHGIRIENQIIGTLGHSRSPFRRSERLHHAATSILYQHRRHCGRMMIAMSIGKAGRCTVRRRSR